MAQPKSLIFLLAILVVTGPACTLASNLTLRITTIGEATPRIKRLVAVSTLAPLPSPTLPAQQITELPQLAELPAATTLTAMPLPTLTPFLVTIDNENSAPPDEPGPAVTVASVAGANPNANMPAAPANQSMGEAVTPTRTGLPAPLPNNERNSAQVQPTATRIRRPTVTSTPEFMSSLMADLRSAVSPPTKTEAETKVVFF